MNKGNKQQDEKPVKQPLRFRISLGGAISFLIGMSILVASLLIGFHAIKTLRDNKLRDTWAIMYLELEKKTDTISKQMDAYFTTAQTRPKYHRLKVGKNGQMSNVEGFPDLSGSAKDIGLGRGQAAQYQFVDISGRIYVSQRSQSDAVDNDNDESVYVLEPVDISRWLRQSTKMADETLVYVVNQGGQLIFSNSFQVDAVSFMKRNLVKKFIRLPVSQGRFSYDQGGEAYYGMFQMIAGTNLILFSETPERVALAPVTEVMLRSVVILVIVIALALIFVQEPINRIVKPVRELVRLSIGVGKGIFDGRPRQRSFGEIAVLTETFSAMNQSLSERDAEILELMEEQKEKVRIEGELKVAQGIQANLLPHNELPKECGLDVAAAYLPASECAGDYYNYFYNERANETVFLVADVSGHGAGSSMFTAMIAAIFENCKRSSDKYFPVDEFFSRVNHAVYELGQQKWHATAQLLSFRPQTGKILIYNAGHVAPLIISPAKKLGFPNMRSNVLGLDQLISVYYKEIDYADVDQVLLYTDGLIECRNRFGKTLKKRSLMKSGAFLASSARQVIVAVEDQWRGHLDGVPADDDVCLISVRAG